MAGHMSGAVSRLQRGSLNTQLLHTSRDREQENPAILNFTKVGPFSNAKKESNVLNWFQLPLVSPLLSLVRVVFVLGKENPCGIDRPGEKTDCRPTLPP